MLADDGDNGPGENPLIRGLGRVIIIDSTAGRVAAVDGIPGRPVGRVRHSRIDPAVIQAVKSARLIDNAGQGIGKAGMGHPV